MQEGLTGYNAWRDGDEASGQELISAYNKRLIYYVFSLTGSEALSEDIACEAFVRLLLKRPKFQNEEQLRAWLFKSARNIAIDQKKLKSAQDYSLEEAQERPSADDPPQEILANEQNRQLHAALRSLPDDYREVLILLYFEELSYTQIARVTKKSEKQIKNLAYRARQQCKAQLERMGFEYENR